MNNWQTKKLGDICQIINGYSFKSTDYKNTGIKLLRMSNITREGLVSFDNDNTKYLDPTFLSTYSRFVLNSGDLILALTDMSKELGIIGKVAIVNQDDVLLNQRVGKIQIVDNEINQRFLYYILLCKQFKRFVEGLCLGGLQYNVSSFQILKYSFSIPPLSIQQQIVERLDAIRKLQELNNKEIGKAEELFEVLLDKKFYPTSDWKKYKLADMSVLKRGPFGGSLKKEIFVEKGFKVYEQKNAIYNDFNLGRYFITERKFKEMIDFAVKPGDLIISCSGTIGKVALAPNNVQQGIINQALLRITPVKDRVLGTYIKYLIQNNDMQNKMFGGARGSSIKNIVSMKEIKEIAVFLPTIEKQKKFVDELITLENYIEKLRDKNKLLKELFESTLNKLIKPNYEKQ